MTKATRVQNIRTPGAPAADVEQTKPTAEQCAEMDAEAEALDAELLADSDVVRPQAEVAGVAPDLAAFIQAEIAKGVAKGLASQRRAAAGPVPGEELPDQSEIDAFSIKKEVLTKQGYVVPAQYPQGYVPQALR